MNREECLTARILRSCAFLTTATMLVALFATISLFPSARAAQDFGQKEPGQHVYDEVGLLTSSEVEDLESRAAAVEQAGAPTVVYLRIHEADYEATQQDAKELMDAWHVQSGPDARDGLVIFLNLKPDDPRHGQVSLYAGQSLLKEGGALPQSELERISDEEVRPLLAEGQTARGIGAGLDAVAKDLESGGPSGSAKGVAATLARVPANLLAVLCAAGVIALVARARRERPTAPIAPAAATTMPPDDLAPALVGMLLGRKSAKGQAEATILDLGRRGALAIEPDEDREFWVRLLDRGELHSAHEKQVWETLREHAVDDADSREGVVSSRDLPGDNDSWLPVQKDLHRELIFQGLYDPSVRARRRPLYLAGAVALLLAVATLLAIDVGREPWGVPAAALLLIVGAGTILYARYRLPETTAEGERRAARWRGYLAGLKESAQQNSSTKPNLDEAMPYAVALGVAGVLEERLRAASSRGHIPAWLGPEASAETWDGGFYPYWLSLHAVLAPPSGYGIGSGSGYYGGGSAGGTSSGGGGAGGGF